MLDKPLLRLLLVRHGHTMWNEMGRCLGRTDLPLSTSGRQAVMALAPTVDFTDCTAAYCSPARRAVETAELLMNGASASARIREDLREIDFGVWEGLTWNEICLRRSEEWRLWKQDPIGSAPYQGESLGDVATRVTRSYREILALHEGESVLVIGHGGTLNVLLCQLFGIPPGVLWAFDLQPASFSELLINAEGPILTRLSCSPHVRLAGISARAAMVQ